MKDSDLKHIYIKAINVEPRSAALSLACKMEAASYALRHDVTVLLNIGDIITIFDPEKMMEPILLQNRCP